jgi:hypothetical protein
MTDMLFTAPYYPEPIPRHPPPPPAPNTRKSLPATGLTLLLLTDWVLGKYFYQRRNVVSSFPLCQTLNYTDFAALKPTLLQKNKSLTSMDGNGKQVGIIS